MNNREGQILPFRFEGHSKVLPLSSTSSIMRRYFRGEGLDSAIQNSVFLPPRSARYIEQEERELFEVWFPKF